jgi:hypothetical protein
MLELSANPHGVLFFFVRKLTGPEHLGAMPDGIVLVITPVSSFCFHLRFIEYLMLSASFLLDTRSHIYLV